MTRKNTKPDAPKAIERTLNMLDVVGNAEVTITSALQTLADELSGTPSVETIVAIQGAVKAWTKRLEDTEKISKGMLIEYLKANGQQTTDKGSLGVTVAGFSIEARPHRTGLDAKKVEALLRAKELSVDALMDKDIRYMVNESRLQLAITEGVLTADELETCKYELSYALQPIKKVSK